MHVTANADNNLQCHERGKIGRMHKPSTPNTHFIHGDEVIGELYQKNMVLIPFTIDPWARFGPMLQAFLITTHHPRQKSLRTAHANSKYHRPNANLMYECAYQPPCPLRILIFSDIRWTQSASPTRWTFFGNSYTAPTPSLHSLQLIGPSISKAYSTLLCNAMSTFQLHPTAPTFDLYSFLTLEDTYSISIPKLNIYITNPTSNSLMTAA